MPVRNNKARKPNKASRNGIINARIEKERNLLTVKGRRYDNYTIPVLSQLVIGIDKPIIEL
jgi:hypothetical protein